ncbi:MAG: MalY/PatB family protein [Motilibacteraceae bacterium]
MDHPWDQITLAQLRDRRSAKWRRDPADALPAWVAEMDLPLAGAVREALVAAVERSDTGYMDPFGLRTQEAWARWAHDAWGQSLDPSLAVVVPDVVRGLEAVLSAPTPALSPAGAPVVVDSPCYPPFVDVLAATGRPMVRVPMARDAEGRHVPDLDAVAAAYRAGARVHLLCNPQNPTGTVLRPAELLGLAELAERHDVLVVADEIHAPLTRAGVAFTPFASLDHPAARRAVTLVSASKAWNLAGLKCALLLAGPDGGRELLEAVPHEVTLGASLFGQLATEAALDGGRAWLEELRGYLDAGLDRLDRLLTEQLPQVRWQRPEGTYLAWLDCRGLPGGAPRSEVGGEVEPAARFLDLGRVSLGAGLDFGPEGAGHVRLTTAVPHPVLDEIVRRMSAAVG